MDNHVREPERIAIMRLGWRGEHLRRCCGRSRRPTATPRDGLRFQCSTLNPARQESASLSHVAGHGLLAPKSVVHRLAALPLLDRRDGSGGVVSSGLASLRGSPSSGLGGRVRNEPPAR